MTDVLHLVLTRELFGVSVAFLFGMGFGVFWSVWRHIFAARSRFLDFVSDVTFSLLVGMGILLHALSYTEGILRLSSILAGAAGFSTCRWIFLKFLFPFRKK